MRKVVTVRVPRHVATEPRLLVHSIPRRRVQRRRQNLNAKRLRGSKIDDQVEFCRLLDRQMARLFPFENAADIATRDEVYCYLAAACAVTTIGLMRRLR